MPEESRLGFLNRRSRIRNLVYIPKYYDIDIKRDLARLEASIDLILLGDLVGRGEVSVSTGHEVGKMAYGTGTIPFVRTSDIANWEIKSDPKQGVSQEIYEIYADKQDVRAGDILLVRDGTYLIGQTCLITEADTRMVFQSHLLKFRVEPESSINPPLLLLMLSSPIVQSQIRSVQFTADIIDTIGNRYNEIYLPVPRTAQQKEWFGSEANRIVAARSELRERLRRIPFWAQDLTDSLEEPIPDLEEEFAEEQGKTGFKISSGRVQNSIFIPRYYDPEIDKDLEALSNSFDLMTLGDLEREQVVQITTGDEVGKMAYGTGPVPFVRTSDLTNWELKVDPKQSVGLDIYEKFAEKQDAMAGDILVVRDGTYLVGTSCIITENDPDLLFASGLFKIRVLDRSELDPYLLIALLNTPIVRRQMRSKQFTRDIIDTLGNRIKEVLVPAPKDGSKRREIAKATKSAIERRASLKAEASQLILQLDGTGRRDAAA